MKITRPKLIPKHVIIQLAWLAGVILAAFLLGALSFIFGRSYFLSQIPSVQLSGPQIAQPANPTQISLLLGDTEDIPAELLAGIPLPDESVVPSAAELAPWDGSGRVTVLVLGLDYRDWSGGAKYARSDTMILLTLDPLTKEAGILSIPRDMWVAIPGFKHGKINTAHYLGDAYKMPGGGPGLAARTVEQFLGVPVNYYVQVDFNAFVRFIDEIGGVKIDVPEQITIDLLGSGHQTKKTLQPGVQTLPGEWALAYARNRKTSGGDFDRARRQQQVIMGIRDRLLSLDALPTLIGKAPALYQELKAGFNTNLGLEDAIRLALLAQQVPNDQIKRGVLDQKYVIFGRSPDNLSILIPIPDKVHTLRDDIFATGAGLGPLTPGDSLQRMQAEGSRITIYNGSREAGLAERTAGYLRDLGGNVISVSDASQRYAATTIIVHAGKPYTLRFLVDLLKINPNRVYLEYDPNAAAEVELFLGYDAEGIGLP